MATITKDSWGNDADGNPADIYTLTNDNGLIAKISNYGALLISLEVPDRDGNLGDITLGYNSIEEYIKDTPYFGATVGRYANRIAKGKFTVDDEEYCLAANNGPNALHGGLKGYDKVIWDAELLEAPALVGLKLTYLDPDGAEGYPGNVNVTVIYTLNNDNELRINYDAATDKPTVINLTHHSYFNLAGDGAGVIYDHELTLKASQYTPVDETLIPTGEIASVTGTPLDFTAPTPIGERIDQVEGGGYDHNYVLNNPKGALVPAARVYEPTTGRQMEIWTTQPGIQLYTGNFLDGSMTGKAGKPYDKHTGFCLETQHYPDSPNQPDFPTTILRPDETFNHTTVHKFSTR